MDRHLCDELRTFDDVKLDLFEAGAEVLQVSYSPPPSTPLEALLQPAGSSSLVELAKAALPVLSSLASLDVKAGQPLALDADIRDRYRLQDDLQDDRWMSAATASALSRRGVQTNTHKHRQRVAASNEDARRRRRHHTTHTQTKS